MKLSQLYTRQAANDGRRLELPLPDGSPSGEWLHVLHSDSDAFRAKRADVMARAAQLPPDTAQDERKRLMDDAMLELLASLVSGWSLEDEFSEAAVIDLLRNAPYIHDWLDRKTSDASLFFGKTSTG